GHARFEPLVVEPCRVKSPERIVALAERCRSLFDDYPSRSRLGFTSFDPDRDSEYEDDDRYHVLPRGKMPQQLVEAICASFPGFESRVKTSYFQIQRYDRGDYVLPHRDSLRQAIFVLTTSSRDGLVVQASCDHLTRIADVAGSMILADPT